MRAASIRPITNQPPISCHLIVKRPPVLTSCLPAPGAGSTSIECQTHFGLAAWPPGSTTAGVTTTEVGPSISVGTPPSPVSGRPSIPMAILGL